MSDISEKERGKGPYARVQEKFNLFTDSLKDSFFWQGSSIGSKTSADKKGETLGGMSNSNSIKMEKAASEVPVEKESKDKDTPGTSRSAPLNQGVYKLFGKPVKVQEKHSSSTREYEARVESKNKKDENGEQATKVIHNHFHTHHVTEIKKPEEPKPVDLKFDTYKDLRRHVSKTVTKSEKYVSLSNDEDLKDHAEICKDLANDYKNEADGKTAKEEKKKRKVWTRFFCGCSECCVQCAECI